MTKRFVELTAEDKFFSEGCKLKDKVELYKVSINKNRILSFDENGLITLNEGSSIQVVETYEQLKELIDG